MFRLALAVLLITLHLVAGARLSIAYEPDNSNGEWEGKVTSEVHSNRLLSVKDHVPKCQKGNQGALHYLSLSINVTPEQDGSGAVECTDSMRQSIDSAINDVLRDYNKGKKGNELKAALAVSACPAPKSGRNLQTGFVWRLQVICKHCSPDNGDGRRLGGSGKWVRRTLIPELKTSLTNAILASFDGNYIPCLGNSPEVKVTAHVTTKKKSMEC